MATPAACAVLEPVSARTETAADRRGQDVLARGRLGVSTSRTSPKEEAHSPVLSTLPANEKEEGLGYHVFPPCSSEADLISNEPPGCGPHCHLLGKEERGFVPQSDFTVSPNPAN